MHNKKNQIMHISHQSNSSTAICLQDYELQAYIGVYDDEKNTTQTIRVSVVIWLKAYDQVDRDTLDATISYVDLRNIVTHHAQSGHTILCEILAEKIAADSLKLAGVQSVQVDLLKLDRFTDCNVGVSIRRSQTGA